MRLSAMDFSKNIVVWHCANEAQREFVLGPSPHPGLVWLRANLGCLIVNDTRSTKYAAHRILERGKNTRRNRISP